VLELALQPFSWFKASVVKLKHAAVTCRIAAIGLAHVRQHHHASCFETGIIAIAAFSVFAVVEIIFHFHKSIKLGIFWHLIQHGLLLLE